MPVESDSKAKAAAVMDDAKAEDKPKTTQKPPSKEEQKRAYLNQQIDANVASPAIETTFNGKRCLKTMLVPMIPYSNKVLTAADQLVLAVDRIEAPEVKAGITPSIPITMHYIDPSAEIYDYATRLSLNSGDRPAMRIITYRLQACPIRRYHFKQEELPDNVGERDFVVAYPRKTDEDDSAAIVFDLYDGGVLSGTPKVPSTSIVIEIAKVYHAAQDAPTMRWDYTICFHVDEPEKPKDAMIKSEYQKMQAFMRSIIVAMGILPSKF